MTNHGRSTARRVGWLALLSTVLVALVIVAAPVWIVQPFKPQTAGGLTAAMAMRRWSPIVTIAAVIASCFLVAWLWRGSRRWLVKVVLAVLLLPVIAATWFARQNHFEWMFNPLANSAYAKPADASFTSDSDMVLAVEHNGEAVAYPVRLIAYHHIVQDTVGGTPLVATY